MTSVKIGYLRALIVDDSLIFRTKLRDMLKQAGFKHLDFAVDAVEADTKIVYDEKGNSVTATTVFE